MIYIYPPSHRQYLNKIMLLVFQELNHNLNLLALCGVPSLVSTYWALPWCGDLFFHIPMHLLAAPHLWSAFIGLGELSMDSSKAWAEFPLAGTGNGVQWERTDLSVKGNCVQWGWKMRMRGNRAQVGSSSSALSESLPCGAGTKNGHWHASGQRTVH